MNEVQVPCVKTHCVSKKSYRIRLKADEGNSSLLLVILCDTIYLAKTKRPMESAPDVNFYPSPS